MDFLVLNGSHLAVHQCLPLMCATFSAKIRTHNAKILYHGTVPFSMSGLIGAVCDSSSLHDIFLYRPSAALASIPTPSPWRFRALQSGRKYENIPRYQTHSPHKRRGSCGGPCGPWSVRRTHRWLHRAIASLHQRRFSPVIIEAFSNESGGTPGI